MDGSTMALTVFWATLMLMVTCSSSISFGVSKHDRFVVSKVDEAEQVFQLIGHKYGRSLFVAMRNNMAGSARTATVISDCYAFSDSGQLLSSLGAGPITPTTTAVYWMNLIYFTPSIGTVDCNMTAPAGNSRTLTMYDDKNMELSYLNIQWSIDERGFSLYNSVSDNFDLYQTW